MDGQNGCPIAMIDASSLTCWQDVPATNRKCRLIDDKLHEYSPFPFREDLNRKINLWDGDLTTLKVHAIVNPTNELLNDDNPISRRILVKAGPGLKEALISNVRSCKTGDAKMTEGFSLPCRFIIHTVGPRYNAKYQTAAEFALHSAYRRVLQIAREHRLPSLAIPIINSVKRGYPPDQGAHIAIRTVRRFLEHFGDSFESVVLCVSETDLGIYGLLMPLYFPRNRHEEQYACFHLPVDVGDEFGEPIIHDRRIRIIDNPQHALEESVDLSEQLQTSVSIGEHDFCKMHLDRDKQRLLGQSRSSGDPFSEAVSEELYRVERYERLLRRAKSEDLSEISGIGCLYQSGVDKLGRPVIVFVGRWFDLRKVDLEKATLYLIHLLDTVTNGDYVVSYFHTLTTSYNRPPLHWIREVYSTLPYRYKKNLKAFYIVHPTFWTKVMTWWFTTFMAPAIKNKVHGLSGIEYLYSVMEPDQLEIPAFITEHDMTINGIRYYQPTTTL
ncbi:unnamed protein product [Notodromas monacha]|uniref:Protein GDAP2 homolog n=1 Tax=Notodromas monacha TaxID=399045 RepID=A0A7R9GDZ1_9CRUS|nr:unnamed protein product [Notodromas monacha]CAG0917720.1 unnamed protein product [Notodromas monacha]